MLCAAAYSSAIDALLCSNKRIKYWVSLYGIKLRSKFFVTKWFISDDCRMQKSMQILHHLCYRSYHDHDNLKGMEYRLDMYVSCHLCKRSMYFVGIHAIYSHCLCCTFTNYRNFKCSLWWFRKTMILINFRKYDFLV